MVVMDHVGQLFKSASCLCNTEGLIAGCGAGSVVEEGLQWDVKVNSNDDIRAQRVNKSLAAMLTLRSACHVNTNPKCVFLYFIMSGRIVINIKTVLLGLLRPAV